MRAAVTAFLAHMMPGRSGRRVAAAFGAAVLFRSGAEIALAVFCGTSVFTAFAARMMTVMAVAHMMPGRPGGRSEFFAPFGGLGGFGGRLGNFNGGICGVGIRVFGGGFRRRGFCGLGRRGVVLSERQARDADTENEGKKE